MFRDEGLRLFGAEIGQHLAVPDHGGRFLLSGDFDQLFHLRRFGADLHFAIGNVVFVEVSFAVWQ